MLPQTCETVRLKSIFKKFLRLAKGGRSCILHGFKEAKLFFDCEVNLLGVCAKIIHSETANNSNIREIKSAVHTA